MIRRKIKGEGERQFPNDQSYDYNPMNSTEVNTASQYTESGQGLGKDMKEKMIKIILSLCHIKNEFPVYKIRAR